MAAPKTPEGYPIFFWELATGLEDWDRDAQKRRDEYRVPTPEGWNGSSLRVMLTSFRKLLRMSSNARYQELGEVMRNFSIRAGDREVILVRKGPKWGMESVLGSSPERMQELRLLRAGLVGRDLTIEARAGGDLFQRLAEQMQREPSVLEGFVDNEAGKNLGFEERGK